MEQGSRSRSATRNSWVDYYDGSDTANEISNPMNHIEIPDINNEKHKKFSNNLNYEGHSKKQKLAVLRSHSKKKTKLLDALETKLKRMKNKGVGNYKRAYKLWSFSLVIVVSSAVAFAVLISLTQYDSKNLVTLQLNIKHQVRKTLNDLTTVTENQAIAVAQVAKRYNLKNRSDRQLFLETLQSMFLTVPLQEENIVSAMHGFYVYLSDGTVLGVQRIFESYKSLNPFCNDTLMYWCWGSAIFDATNIFSTGCEANCPPFFPPDLESSRCKDRECEVYEEDYTEIHGLERSSPAIINNNANRWLPHYSEEGSVTDGIITYISCESRIMHNGDSIVGVTDITFDGFNTILSSISKYFTPDYAKNSYKNGRISPVLLGIAENIQNKDGGRKQVSIIGSSYLSADSIKHGNEKKILQKMTNSFLLLLSKGATGDALQANYTVKNRLLISSSQSRYWSVSKYICFLSTTVVAVLIFSLNRDPFLY